MIGLLLVGFIQVSNQEGERKIYFNSDIFTNFRAKSRLPFFVILFYFLIVLFSIFQIGEDHSYFLERLRIKLPFLVLPFAFIGLPQFSERQINGLLYFLLLILTITSIGIGINYGLNAEEINNAISKGKPMPTPRNHIRYSLLVGVGIIGGIHLISKKYFWKKPQERYFIIGLTIFLFLFIHILSVKSGILCLYAAVGILTIRYIFLTKKIVLGLSLLFALICLPIVAFKTIPSFHQKLTYMHYDFLRYMSNKGEQYSDAGRLTSLKVGYEIYLKNPIFGVGAGNLKREVDQIYDKRFPDYVKPIMPHNQFLFVLAGNGLFGLALFLVAFFLPLFYQKAYRNVFFLGFYSIFFVAFVIEHTIENSIGVGTFVFFLLLFLKFRMKE